MKKLRNMMAILLAMVMVLAMSITTLAVEGVDLGARDLTVKLNNGSLVGKKVSIFKLFDYNTDEEPLEEVVGTDLYTVNSTYASILQELLKTDTQDSHDLYSAMLNLGEDNNPTVQKFANDFTTKVLENKGTLGTDYKESGEITTETYTFQGLKQAYYLVYLEDSTDTQSSLVTVNKDTEITLKAKEPIPDKEAYDSTGATVVNDVQIGDVLAYKVTIELPDTSAYDTYVFTLEDTLSAGLTFVKNVDGEAVVDKKLPVTVTVDGGTASNLEATIDPDNDQKMTIDLSSIVIDETNQADKVGTDIVVTYYAQVNENAILTNTENSVTLEYSNDPIGGGTGTSTPDVVKTPTFAINVHKYEEGKETEYLAGAVFELRKETAEGTVIKLKDNGNGSYVVAGDQNDVDAVDTATTNAAAIAGENYNLQINGLSAGTYYLVETTAPDGFTKADPIKLVIANTTASNTPSYTITVNDSPDVATDNIVDVVNKSAPLLPSTGGMGTVIFTVVGIVLILGVGVSFVISRKRNAE